MKGSARGKDDGERCCYRPSPVYNGREADVAGHVDALRISGAHAAGCGGATPSASLSHRWVFIIFVVMLSGVCKAHPAAKRLHDDLLSDYNRLIRPVGNHSHKVTVHLGLKLSQLIDIVSIAYDYLNRETH